MRYNKILLIVLITLFIGCNNSERALKKLDFENNKAKLYELANSNVIANNDFEYLLHENDELRLKDNDGSFHTFEKNNIEANQIVSLMDDLNIRIIYKYDRYYQFDLNSSCHIITYNLDGNNTDIESLKKIGKWYSELDENWLLEKSECYAIE